MAKRLQSPSSINTYRQCPRKYYYSYIAKLPRLPSIHTVRGHVAHKVLEDFFELKMDNLTMDTCKERFRSEIQTLLLKEWNGSKQELGKLNLNSNQLMFYFEETLMMLLNWLNQFVEKLAEDGEKDFVKLFRKHTPIREKYYRSESYYVQGFIDAIEYVENKVRLMDYKTSKRDYISDDYRLQLAVYSLLYLETHGELPHRVGIYFLKHTPKFLDVDEELLDFARREIEIIHKNTASVQIDDYPKKISGLCRWSSGQCDFYVECFNQKRLRDY